MITRHEWNCFYWSVVFHPEQDNFGKTLELKYPVKVNRHPIVRRKKK